MDAEDKVPGNGGIDISAKRKEALAHAGEFDCLILELQNSGHLCQSENIAKYIQNLKRIQYLSGYLAEHYSALRRKG